MKQERFVRYWKMRVVAVLLSTGLALLASELALRVIWHNPYRMEHPDHVLKLRIHHPNTDHLLDRSLIDEEIPTIRMRTDGRSYILPSFQFDDPDVTIAFLGGSTTECEAVQEHLRFPALVSELLGEQGLRVNTLNAGRSGNTMHDSINNLLNHVILDKPDIAVVMHATNDIGLMRNGRGYRSKMGHPVNLQDLGKWQIQMLSARSSIFGLFRQSLQTAGRLQPKTPKTVDPTLSAPLPAVPTEGYRSRLRTFIGICRAFDVLPVLMTQPQGRKKNFLSPPPWSEPKSQDVFNDIIREIGAELNVTVIDLARHLREDIPGWDDPMNVFYDGGHVTDSGSRVYAEHIFSELHGLVRRQEAKTE